MVTSDQIKHLKKRASSIHDYLKIPEKKIDLQEKELKTQDPSFWEDPKSAENFMKEIRTIKFWVDSHWEINNSLEELILLIDFVKEGVSSEEELNAYYQKVLTMIEELELKNMLSGEEDSFNAILQITAGAGGTESCDWASMLMRMYVMWGQKNNMKIKGYPIHENWIDIGSPDDLEIANSKIIRNL